MYISHPESIWKASKMTHDFEIKVNLIFLECIQLQARPFIPCDLSTTCTVTVSVMCLTVKRSNFVDDISGLPEHKHTNTYYSYC